MRVVTRRFPAVCLTAILFLPGCGREITRAITPNQPPQVRLSVEAAATEEGATRYTMSWSAQDPDGRVDRYLVAVDPRSFAPDAAGWTVTRALRHSAEIARPAAAPMGVAPTARAGYHVFAVRAVDEDGAVSAPATRAFFGANAAPTVTILDPAPAATAALVPPSFGVTWLGEDQDGRVVDYRDRLFGRHNPDFPEIENFVEFALANPDSFARLYQPDFRGWTSTPGERNGTSFNDLTIGESYLFAITAFDEDGAYDPTFSNRRNLLKVSVGPPGVALPTITISTEFFSRTVVPVDPSRWLVAEIPADVRLLLTFSAVPAPGTRIIGWRWSINDLPSQGQRWSSDTTATLGPFPGNGDVIFFYLEVATTNLRHLIVLRLTVVRPTFEHALLVVDDCRLPPDQFINGALDPPRGPWPGAAELDTFLFAVGGVPWRHYPPGSVTAPGLFHGYAFDTVGTRGIASGVLPLSILGRYRHVVWYVDQTSATFVSNPLDPRTPITSLRLMNSPNQQNVLAQYLAAGGKLWLMGGGSAHATLISWNRPGTPSDVYTADDLELVPGRFMYDWARWRSSVVTGRSGALARLHLDGVLTPFVDPSTAPGRGWAGQPDYSRLPATLNRRSPGTDPVPPLRSAATFYRIDFPTELITEPNVILEDDASTLDTLYFVPQGAVLQPGMTLHHGADGNPALFSGFGVWEFRRPQAIALVDFVLQDLWGLAREDLPRSSPRAALAGRAGRRD